MHIGKSYTLSEFLHWTRRRIYVLMLVTAVPVVLYQSFGLKWIALPWVVVAVLGTATSFIVGFKNTHRLKAAPMTCPWRRYAACWRLS